MLHLAQEAEDLASKERQNYSPILKKWNAIAAALAALTLNNCYGHVLKQYLSEIKSITVELIIVLQKAKRLEDILVQMIVEESADCDDGGKTVVRQMVPFEVDSTVLNLMRKWIGESLQRGNDCLQRAKETEVSFIFMILFILKIIGSRIQYINPICTVRVKLFYTTI